MRTPKALLRNLLCSCLILLGGFSTGHVQALEAPVPNEFTRQIWRVQDGLPEDTVQAIAQDERGFLWIGTTGGLARFDGSNFLVSDIESSPRLPVNSIFALLAAQDGSLWMGSEGGGLLRRRNGRIESFGTAEGLTDLFVRALLEDERGRLWVGTDNGLFLLPAHGRRLRRVDGGAGVPAIAVHAIAEDAQHRIWVGGSRLVVFSSDGQASAKEYKLPGADSQNRVKSILPAQDGTIWVGTVGGLMRLEGHRFQRVAEVTGTVRTLRQTADGSIWIGTIGNGLWRYWNGRLQRVGTAGLLPSKSILTLYQDRAGRVWIGTQGGLVRLSHTPVHVLPLPQAADPDYETVASDSDGAIWVVASKVFRIRDGVAAPEHFPALGDPPVRDLFRAADGALWIGTDGDGAYRVLGRSVRHFRAPQQLPNNFVRAFLEGRKGDIWIATDEGLARVTGDRVERYGMRQGLVYFSTRCLLRGANGDVWIGTDQGLSDWHAGHFVTNAVTEAMRGEKVWSLARDTAGFLWIGTRDHGLFRARGNQVVQFTKAHGLATNSIYGIAEAGGLLWFSGPDTLFSVPVAELDSSDGSAGEALHVLTYPLPFSANDAQFYGGRQPSVCVDKQGRVWFPSSKGAVYLQPPAGGQEHKASEPLAVFVRSVIVDGQLAASTGNGVVLPAGARALSVNYAPLLLSSQSGVRFRYRLEGFDKSWTYAGSLRTASYTNLPAGKYRFEVQTLDGGEPTAEAVLAVREQPFFWERWWFLTGLLLLMGGAVWAAHRMRLRQMHGRFEAVLLERGRLAREMHDTVIQGCTSISALLEGIASRRGVAGGREAELLDYARTQVRTTIEEARKAVWNLRHREEPERKLLEILEALAANARLEFGIPVTCRWKGEMVLLASPIAHEVSMTVREALCNAAVHGRPREVEVEAAAEWDHVHVRIADDGAGFVPHEEPGHYGILGMRERAARLGGTLQVQSEPGRGTVVELVLVRELLRRKPELGWQ